MRKISLLPFFCGSMLTLFSISSCEDEERVVEIVDKVSTTNKWIHTEMKENYLWLDEIPEYQKTGIDLQPEEYFYSLISDNEIKSINGNAYSYSYIEPKQKTKANHGSINSYGLEYILYRAGETGQSYFARVLYVHPDSPAEKAGIKRGHWVLRVDKQDITAANYQKLDSGNDLDLDIYIGDISEDTGQIVQRKVDASTSLENNPLMKSHILDTQNGKLAYMQFNHFTTGPLDFDDKTWHNDLIAACGEIKTQNVEGLILDLRYNGGGYLETAIVLSSLLAPEKTLGELFAITEWHPKAMREPIHYSLTDKYQSQNLNLKKLYILAGERSASASELVINGFRADAYGDMEVVHIGQTTEGKNLGSIAIESAKEDWILHPIVSKVSNADGFGEYFDGLDPDVFADEFDLKVEPVWSDMGTADDMLTGLAIDHFEGNQIPAKMRTTRGVESHYVVEPELSSIQSNKSIRIN